MVEILGLVTSSTTTRGPGLVPARKFALYNGTVEVSFSRTVRLTSEGEAKGMLLVKVIRIGPVV